MPFLSRLIGQEKTWLLMILLLPQVSYSLFQEQTACPCINPWDDSTISNSTVFISDSNTDNSVACLNLTWSKFPFDHKPVAASGCVPLDYGASGCDAWNQNNSAFALSCNGTSPEDWCSASWCFIDPKQCSNVDFTTSNIEGLELHQSYDACGNKGTYTFENFYSELEGSTLRVAFPPDLDEAAAQVFTRPEGYRDGAAVQFVFNVTKRSDINVTIANFSISEQSRERYRSGYTACVHDVSLGKIDLCVGAFLITPERLQLSSFTTEIYESRQILVVLKTPLVKTSLREFILAPLRPFTLSAWVWMLSAVFYMAFVLSLIREKYDGTYNPGISVSSKIATRATSSVYDGILSLTSGAPSNLRDFPSGPESIIIAGFAIFGWIFITAYQASFTVSLISRTSVEFQSVSDVIQANGMICVWRPIGGHFRLSHPEAQEFVIETATNTETLELIESGRCLAGVMTSTFFDSEIGSNLGRCKTMIQAGSTLFTIPTGMPVSKKFASYMVNIMQASVAKGMYLKLVEKFELELLGPPLCTLDDADTNDDQNGANPLSVNQMVLPIGSTILCTTIGLLIFFTRHYDYFLARYGRWLMTGKLGRWIMKRTFFLRGCKRASKLYSDDSILKQKLLLRSGKGLLSMLDSTNVIQTKLDDAMNALPDTRALVDIIYQQKCTKESRDIIFMQTLSQADLYKLLMNIANSYNCKLMATKIQEAIGDAHNPKRKLMFLVLSSQAARDALQRLQEEYEIVNSDSEIPEVGI